MRNKVIAGNWKMFTTPEQGKTLVEELKNAIKDVPANGHKVIVIPPFTHLSEVISAAGKDGQVEVGAQNCYFEKEGAFTGEISPVMLQSMGCKYVVIGHSERRQYFNEDNELLNKKVLAVLAEELTPIYCCGETLEEREAGNHFAVVGYQVKEGLFNLLPEQVKNIIVAYEPVWAIGTGKTASPEQAQEMHAHIRNLFKEYYGESISSELQILYGGSVKPNNAKTLFGQPDIDGGLVGGASLNANDFAEIIKSA